MNQLTRNIDPWRTIGFIVLTGAIVWIASYLRAIVYPLTFGLILALAALPLVKKFERGMGRSLATVIVFALLSLFFFALVAFIADQFTNLGQELFEINDQGDRVGAAYRGFDWLEKFYIQLDSKFNLGDQGKKWLASLPQQLADSWKEAAKGAGNAFGFIMTFAGSVFGILSLCLLTPLFALLILLEFETLHERLLRLPRAENRTRVAALFEKIEEMLGKFLRGRLLTGLLKGGVQAALLGIVGAPYAALTAILSWGGSFIPVVGPIFAFAPTILLCTIYGHWITLALVIAILILGELIEGYVLIPRMVGSVLGLSTLETILALMVGGALLGFIGLFLAIPLAAIGKILWMDHLEQRAKTDVQP